MSEIAVVAARKVRLQQRADDGDERARAALELANHPAQFLSTVQVGITLVGILAGAYGGATIAEPLAARIATVPQLAPYADGIALGLAKNPKTPLAISLSLLHRLNDRDVRAVSIDRNVPDPLRMAARKKVVASAR